MKDNLILRNFTQYEGWRVPTEEVAICVRKGKIKEVCFEIQDARKWRCIDSREGRSYLKANTFMAEAALSRKLQRIFFEAQKSDEIAGSVLVMVWMFKAQFIIGDCNIGVYIRASHPVLIS
ncbi:uncharacterized protein M6G45_000789 [Spheniscus humboldti]